MSMRHSQSRHTGLSHLVEAATALTRLVDVASPEATKEAPAQLGQLQQSVVSDDDSSSSRRKSASTPVASKEIFPRRLMSILSDPSVSDVISWLPHGRSFVIIRPDFLSDRVLSKYFASTDPRSSTKYSSFTRKLNRWGFRQATRGPDTGAFHHPLFRRDQTDLCLDMVCQKSRKPRGTKSTDETKPEVPSSSLPPKKRKVHDAPASDEAERHSTPRVVSDSSLSSNNVSGDDQSVTSAASSSSSYFDPSSRSAPADIPLLAALAHLPLTPIVVNDPERVAAALKARAEKERLAIARAMLFYSYAKALNGQ